MSTYEAFVEWLSDGTGKGTYSKLIECLKGAHILRDDFESVQYKSIMYATLRDLEDFSLVDFGLNGEWKVQPTQIAVISQNGSGLQGAVIGARDRRVHLALKNKPDSFESWGLGPFGIQIVGPVGDLLEWAAKERLPIETQWIAIQIQESLNALGSGTARRAAVRGAESSQPVFETGPMEIRRSSNKFFKESIDVLPESELGAVLEVEERYSSGRRRYVGTEHGWLRVDYRWALWVCAASVGYRLADIEDANKIAVPLWARLPAGISRAIALASGEPWRELNGKLVSGKIPDSLFYNVKRILSAG